MGGGTFFGEIHLKTKHSIINDAIAELQEGTNLQVTGTPTVKLLKTEIIRMPTQNKKK